MDSLQHFLINLLVIFLSIFFIQFWMHKRGLSSRRQEYLFFFSLGFSILFCMMFPFKISDGLIFDLRFIPFLLACFYTHPITAAALGVLIAVIRFINGGVGVWIPVVTLPILYLLSMWLRPVFHRKKLNVRLVITSSLVFITCTGILVSIHLLFQHVITLSFTFTFIIIHVLGMILSVSLVEYFREQNLLLTKLIRMEKVEIVSHLAASISHEIRNPLTSSRGFVQMVRESSTVTEKEKEFLKIAIEEMDRATDIIHDYLTFAKPSPERVESLSIKEMTEKAIQVINPLSNMNNVIIESTVAPHQVKGNPGLFLQVLVNLFKNSIEAMPQGGQIRVSSKTDDHMVCMIIEDEGVGMTPHQITRLGEPYFSTKEGKGTGLGMMVVFRVIDAMKGEIQIESEVGGGTSITISLPLG
ncbi:GHKL domain-containing protein [Rossellomorea aquimaris]|nr:GHKL domain-containing protein [Rossellomorea aquimaris]